MMASNGKPVILIVDDDVLVLDALKRTLFEQPWVLRRAGSSAEALQTLEAQTVDLVLCDYNMPGGDGLALLRSVRDRYPDTGRLLLTGAIKPEVLDAAAAQALVDGFQEKPWHDADLIENIRHALRRHGHDVTGSPPAGDDPDLVRGDDDGLAMLQRRLDVYRTLLEAVPRGIICVGEDGIVHFMNEYALRHLRIAHAEIGQSVSAVLEPEIVQLVRKVMEHDRTLDLRIGDILLTACTLRTGDGYRCAMLVVSSRNATDAGPAAVHLGV